MRPIVRRALSRLLLVLVVGGTFLPLGLARGQVDIPSDPTAQVSDVPSDPPGEEPREQDLTEAEDPATVEEPPEGLQQASNGSQQTTASLISVKVRSTECVDSAGSESRLGLMKNSAVHSHCP